MQDTQALSDPVSETVEIAKNTRIPMWLVLVYLTLLAWSVWNVFRYWD